jgi:hypothetical protein
MNNKLRFFIIFCFTFSFCLLINGSYALADACVTSDGLCNDMTVCIAPAVSQGADCVDYYSAAAASASTGDTPASSDGTPASSGTIEPPIPLTNPLTGKSDTPDINLIIGKALNGALGLVGSIALVMFIYGGFTWMLAAGSPQRVTKGKDILVWATIGLVVIFSAYGLVNFIFTSVLKPMGT